MHGNNITSLSPCFRARPGNCGFITINDVNNPHYVVDIRYNSTQNTDSHTRTFGKSWDEILQDPKQKSQQKVIHRTLAMMCAFYYQNCINTTNQQNSFKLLYEDFENDKIPFEIDYYAAKIICDSNYQKIRSKFNNSPIPLLNMATIMRDLFVIHISSFFILNESRALKCVNEQQFDKISPTDPCLVNFKLPDPIASQVGGFTWSKIGVKTDIIDLVGTGQLRKFIIYMYIIKKCQCQGSL